MADKITRYQTYQGTIAPGDTFVIHRAGRSVTCFSATADLEIIIDDGSGSFFTAGVAMEFDQPFEKVQLHNPNGSPVDFSVATAMGKVDDNRLTTSGNIKVVDPGVGEESFADVIAKQNEILAMMQNANEQRVPVGVLGNSFFNLNFGAGLTTLIDPSVNLNGVIIRSLIVRNGSGTNTSLTIGSSAPTDVFDYTVKSLGYMGSSERFLIDKPLLLQAGDGLFLYSTGGATDQVKITYNIL